MARGLSAPGVLFALLLLAGGGCAGGRPSESRPAGLTPGNPASLIAEADAAIGAGDANAARRFLDRALAVAPESVSVHLARGRFFTAIRRYRDAKAELDRAASLDPRSPEPAYQLGRAYLAAGEVADARSAFSRAVALDPGHTAARTALAALLSGAYEAAGIPADYAQLGGRTTISRGELGVILAVELGVDPDHTTWRSDEIQRTDWPELDQTWGARWLKASLMRHWIQALPDGSYRLDDPVTRGQLALILARLPREGGFREGLLPLPDTLFADLGERHYLAHAASRAFRLGLPLRGGRFESLAGASGDETLRAVRGLARSLGAVPIVRAEPDPK